MESNLARPNGEKPVLYGKDYLDETQAANQQARVGSVGQVQYGAHYQPGYDARERPQVMGPGYGDGPPVVVETPPPPAPRLTIAQLEKALTNTALAADPKAFDVALMAEITGLPPRKSALPLLLDAATHLKREEEAALLRAMIASGVAPVAPVVSDPPPVG